MLHYSTVECAIVSTKELSVAGVERACRESACAMGYANVRDRQLRVVSNFVRGSDVFAVLPTGYGKSLCYALLPSVFDRLLGKDDSIVVVITPLTAIINDQVSSCMSVIGIHRITLTLMFILC